MLTEIKINNVTVSNSRLLSWEVVETFGDSVSHCKMVLTRGVYTDIPTLNSGMPVTIKRGLVSATDQFVFNGEITSIEKAGAQVNIDCSDKMLDLIKASVTYTYDGVSFPSTESKGSDIASDLITTWGGMTASVVDTGTSVVLKKFICNGVDVYSRLQVLAEIYDYQIFYDADTHTVNFQPKGYTGNSASLIVGSASNNCVNVPTWKFDNTQCVNKLTVKGAVQEVQDQELFTGSGFGTTASFTLGKKPSVVQVWEDSNGSGTWVIKVPGVENSTSGSYDYTIDKENKTVTTTSNWTPGSTANNVRVDYVNSIPVPVQVEDTVSQGKYGVFVGEKMFSDIQNISDAESRGNSFLSKYSEPFVSTIIKPARLVDFDVGELISVTDTINDESRSLVINKIKKRYPHNGDELSLGDRDFKLADWGVFTLERIRRLEEENQNNTDLIVQVRNLPSTVSFKRRYLEVQKKNIRAGNDVMIWDHLVFGFWDSGYLWGGTAFEGTSTASRLVWPLNTYIENFKSTDFKDSGTSTWNTTLGRLVF